MSRFRILPLVAVALVLLAVWWATRSSVSHSPPPATGRAQEALAVSARADAMIAAAWASENLLVAGMADELTVLRRLSLALHGTIPSLEEIRRFEADTKPDRLARWTAAMLRDRRFADYFAERLARSYVGVDENQFILFRRDRFVGWLADRIHENDPYDQIVRRMIAGEGLWTGRPEVNFVTAAFANDEFDENELAGRTVRAFLGQRIDCAQCHDHPFDDWTQPQFEGLAAFYGNARIAFDGVKDHARFFGESVAYTVEDHATLEPRTIQPAVPFGDEWLPDDGTPRERLAAWITHPENRRFERATVNRVWGLLFGRPYKAPVDDLPDPPAEPDLLDVLGSDFREHGYDLRRLILAITASRPFRLASFYTEPAADSAGNTPHPMQSETEFDRHERAWAVFPVTRLRPEQVIGSMLQAGSVKTIDRNSNLLVRTIRFFREQDFIRDYGDPGEDELQPRAATVSQALLRMNGRLTGELAEANPFTAVGRTAAVAGTDAVCLDVLFLVCLTRHPTAAERAALLPSLKGTQDDPKARARAVEDIVWALFNSAEFSWNH